MFFFQEFIPRGRQAVEEHPGPVYHKQQVNIPNEHILLHRLQNVNISSDEDFNEFWCVREIYDDIHESSSKKDATDSRPASPNYMVDFNINSEEELYVKGYTAVWTKGSSKRCMSESILNYVLKGSNTRTRFCRGFASHAIHQLSSLSSATKSF